MGVDYTKDEPELPNIAMEPTARRTSSYASWLIARSLGEPTNGLRISENLSIQPTLLWTEPSRPSIRISRAIARDCDHQVIRISRNESRIAAEHTRVAIVMQSDFGTQLPSLAEQFHVWVADTPVNRRAADALWSVGPGDRTHGVTTFTLYEGESIESSIVNLLPVIDEHHGLREDWATDIVLEVVGVSLTARIRSALEALGPFDILERPDGFTATRAPAV